jgi:histidine phosphotransferase ChpT
MVQSTMALVTLDALDLAALISSRVCHDVIGPVSAIVNGLEVLEEETDEAMRADVLALIRKSGRQASAKLQFARLAFGAAGSAGAAIDTGDAELVAKGFLNDEKLKLSWTAPRLLMPKNRLKLLLNLLVLATSCIPRGGMIDAVVEGDGDAPVFTITARGQNARIPVGIEASLAGEPHDGEVSSHTIQPFYTGLIARAADMAITMRLQDDAAIIVSRRRDAAQTTLAAQSA